MIDLAARYLYGATAPDLSVDGESSSSRSTTLAAFPGYQFGLAEDSAESTPRADRASSAATDEDGKATLRGRPCPGLPASTKPFDATLIVRIADTNGRAVERTLDPAGRRRSAR